jgi:uncharacterized membrane protein
MYNYVVFRDVSNFAMSHNDISGLWKLTVLTSTISLVPLALLFLLPANAKEQQELAISQERSQIGGVIFLFVLFTSLVWTSFSALSELLLAA